MSNWREFMPKKTYMDSHRIISEGFFDKIKSFLSKKPKLSMDRKKEILKKAGLNKVYARYRKQKEKTDTVKK